MNPSPTLLMAVAEQAARKAGKFLLQSLQSKIAVETRKAHDLKIQTDRDTQVLLREFIVSHFPDHSFLGEEGGEGSEGSDAKGWEWIVDPLDGTINFAHGIPHFCTSVACRHDGILMAGAIFDPIRNECFTAAKGGGAFCNYQPLQVSRKAKLEDAIVALGLGSTEDNIKKCVELYQYYAPHTLKLRTLGAAALDMAYVASGRLDGFLEEDIKIWDIAAGQLILEEAGGKVELTPRPERHHYRICASNGLMPLSFL